MYLLQTHTHTLIYIKVYRCRCMCVCVCQSVCDVLVSFGSPWQNDKRNVFCHKISFRKRVINNIKFDAGRPLYMSSLSLAPPTHIHSRMHTYTFFKSVCVFGSCPGLSFWAFCGALNTCYFMILLGTQHATRKGGGGSHPNPTMGRRQVHGLVFET